MGKITLYISIFSYWAFNYNFCFGQTDKINDSLIYKAKMVQFISEGKFDSLINDTDTLGIFFNRSSCVHMENHFVSFYKYNNSIYVKCKINYDIDGTNSTICPSKIYQINSNDTLNFGFLLSKIHTSAKDYRDSLDKTRNILSVGVLHRWGKMYYINNESYEFSYFLDLYEKIMHSIYPDIEIFTPIIIEKINEEEIINKKIEIINN